jgi:Mrp family chromosome partitioning ATPase
VTAEGEHRHASTLRDYLNVARRRKWIILQAVVIVPVIAVVLSVRHQKLYEAQAQVLLNPVNLANALTGIPDSSFYQTPDRIAQTQADVARVPDVAIRAVEKAGIRGRTGYGLLASSSVEADPNSNLLIFSVTDTDPLMAERLATAYAREYTTYRHELDTASLAKAVAGVQTRLRTLRAKGEADSALYTTLVGKVEQLRTMEALQTSNASLIRPADGAWKIQPKPKRAGLLGLALGIILGLGAAFLREALDTRVRSADEVSDRLEIPLLARLPEPAKRLRRDNQLAMISEPGGPQAEPFRILRTNLDFVRIDRDVRTIMFTSAVEAEGKSTTAANLAAALARVGQHVVLVDLDLRRPFLHKFFDLGGRPGLTQVALGHASLKEALAPIPVLPAGSPTGSSRARAGGRNGNGYGQVDGLLEVLGSGPIPPNVDEFVGTQAVASILAELRKRADIVLVDTTPLLAVGDAIALAPNVDALILVTRLNVIRRPMLRDLHRILESSPTQKLGFVVTGAGEDDGYYGYESYSYRRAAGRTPKELVR